MLQPGIAEETTGSPKFLGNPNCPFAHVPIRRRQDCLHQTVHSAAAWPLVFQRQRLPRKVFRRSIAWLSNSLRAPCAAGSASQDGLPRHHARLASGRWSGTTGRAFHPEGSYERFQSCFLTSHPPFPSFAWHNEIDRRTETRSYRGREHCAKQSLGKGDEM